MIEEGPIVLLVNMTYVPEEVHALMSNEYTEQLFGFELTILLLKAPTDDKILLELRAHPDLSYTEVVTRCLTSVYRGFEDFSDSSKEFELADTSEVKLVFVGSGSDQLLKDLTTNFPQAVIERRPDPELLESPYKGLIEELDLSTRAYHCMKRGGIQTIEDLLTKSESDLLALPNFAMRSLDEVVSKLESRDLSLRA